MIEITKIDTGIFAVTKDGKPTKYVIFNGSAGLSGRGGNVYGIKDTESKKNTQIGSLAKAKKTVIHWLTK